MKEAKRFYSIDILKVILAVCIVCHHFQQMLNISYEGHLDFYGGDTGFFLVVEFFFLISGFLMAGGIKKKHDVSFKGFMVPRLIRLYPMAAISVLASVLFLLVGKIIADVWAYFMPDIWVVLTSLLLVFQGGVVADVDMGINNPLWYLCVLLLCYVLLWAVNKMCVKKNVNPILIYIMIVLLATGIKQYEIELPFFNHISSRGFVPFFGGLLLYEIYERMSHVKIMVISASILILYIVSCKIDHYLYIMHQEQAFVYIVFPSILMLLISLEGLIKSNKKIKLFEALGGISFEMYLWHLPLIIVMAVAKAFLCVEWGYKFEHMCIFTAIVIVWSTVMYYAVEKPVTRKLNSKWKEYNVYER